MGTCIIAGAPGPMRVAEELEKDGHVVLRVSADRGHINVLTTLEKNHDVDLLVLFSNAFGDNILTVVEKVREKTSKPVMIIKNGNSGKPPLRANLLTAGATEVVQGFDIKVDDVVLAIEGELEKAAPDTQNQRGLVARSSRGAVEGKEETGVTTPATRGAKNVVAGARTTTHKNGPAVTSHMEPAPEAATRVAEPPTGEQHQPTREESEVPKVSEKETTPLRALVIGLAAGLKAAGEAMERELGVAGRETPLPVATHGASGKPATTETATGFSFAIDETTRLKKKISFNGKSFEVEPGAADLFDILARSPGEFVEAKHLLRKLGVKKQGLVYRLMKLRGATKQPRKGGWFFSSPTRGVCFTPPKENG